MAGLDYFYWTSILFWRKREHEGKVLDNWWADLTVCDGLHSGDY